MAKAGMKRLIQRLAPADWRLQDASDMILELQDRARAANLVLEVRDARLPLTSANQEIYDQILGWKKHIVLLNKSDLVERTTMEQWKGYFQKRNVSHVFVNAHNKESVKEMVKEVKAVLEDVIKSQRTSMVLLMGLPNVGKSVISNTLHRVGRYNISALEKLTLAKVAPEPYTTKTISGYKINYYPPMYVLDTPGLMHNQITDPEIGMKLALTGTMPDEVVGVEQLAKYFLALWNSRSTRQDLETWVDAHRAHEFGKKPMDKFSAAEKRQIGHDDFKIEVKGILAANLLDFLNGDIEGMEELIEAQLIELQNFFQLTTVKQMDMERASSKLLNLYRVGKLGRFTWDTVPETEQVVQTGPPKAVTGRHGETQSQCRREHKAARIFQLKRAAAVKQQEFKIPWKPKGRRRKVTTKIGEENKIRELVKKMLGRKSRNSATASQMSTSHLVREPSVLWTKIQALNPPTRGDPKTWRNRRRRFHVDFKKICWRPLLDMAGIFRRKF